MFTSTPITNYADLEAELNAALIEYDMEKIKRAYEWAEQLHAGAVRRSGEPLTNHLLSTAAYLTRIKLDTDSIVAALLHEAPEADRQVVDKIDAEFGTEVAFIVDGIQDIKQATAAFQNHSEDPTSFRFLMLKSADDIRVLIVRLASKLHDALTLDGLEEQKRVQQAHKIELVYAPLCEYLGLGSFLAVFENQAFQVLNPEASRMIEAAISSAADANANLFSELIAAIKSQLEKYEITNYEVSFRTKNALSAFRKIKRKYLLPGEELTPQHVNQLKDLLGIRVIVDDIAQCYMVLGSVHNQYEYFQEEFDDYIIKPKQSGYKSIHTVIAYQGRPVEVQIRTFEMHEYNEFGPASHIAYKLLGEKGMRKANLNWTRNLSEWKNEDNGNDKYKIQAFADSIFVFTPKGKVIQLDKNSTLIDFAFMIHTDLGSRYQGGLVNGKMRPMTHVIETGDVVEIITSKKVNVTSDWLKHCSMNSTRYKIRKYLRDQTMVK